MPPIARNTASIAGAGLGCAAAFALLVFVIGRHWRWMRKHPLPRKPAASTESSSNHEPQSTNMDTDRPPVAELQRQSSIGIAAESSLTAMSGTVSPPGGSPRASGSMAAGSSSSKDVRAAAPDLGPADLALQQLEAVTRRLTEIEARMEVAERRDGTSLSPDVLPAYSAH
uniref:Uncharacterized protein n=1 Tax=Mycena chlorophos TaxID=658473 RepID=A0ABQ0L5A4_MYCCL|nr:predicted protein [Mycena chlorophos]